MKTSDIIIKKKAGLSLSKNEIEFIIDGYVKGSIPDYQISSLLMAICFVGMNEEETGLLTSAMMHSGDVIDLSVIKGIKVDKHSTGGVGDKTSLVLGPLVASCGVKVAKMSGRGLGHTGGTIDKLESIPGFKVELSKDQFIKQVNEINLALIGQSGNLVPADKKLYALRDVTGTVESIPLIASSIMSKKLATGADAVLLDVKCGNGAFMKDIASAKKLAEAMCRIGKFLKRDTRAIITDMDQPLGKAIGNANEVIEAIDTLKGHGPKDLHDLCIYAGAMMLMQAKKCATLEQGKALLEEKIASGAAFEVFKQMVSAQGGDATYLDNVDKFPKARHRYVVTADREGYVKRVVALTLGTMAMKLGAGREKKEDNIDFSAGIYIEKKVGDRINKGDKLAELHTNLNLNENELIAEMRQAYIIDAAPVAKEELIKAVIDESLS